VDLKELLENPRTAGFSRIKYLQSYGTEEQMAEFINGLFLEAFNAKYSGDWDAFIAFMEGWEDVALTGQFNSMEMPEGDIPWATLSKSLSSSKIGLVTTGGLYVEGQEPFERGDTSYRLIPSDVRKEDIRIRHRGYDNGPANKDINCVYPLDRFKEMEAEGVIGELSATGYSFMGLINDTETLINESAPEVARALKEDGVDAVFLAST
jgi:D-proline reductase (dithiol) PrdB